LWKNSGKNKRKTEPSLEKDILSKIKPFKKFNKDFITKSCKYLNVLSIFAIFYFVKACFTNIKEK
jgi:hypothetical protein